MQVLTALVCNFRRLSEWQIWNADWQVDNCKEMLSKLMKTVSRLEEYLNFGIGIVLRSFHNIFYLVYVLNLPVCKSTVYICHTAIFEAGILSWSIIHGVKLSGAGVGAIVIVYWDKVRVGSFCKREKVGHLECAFQRTLPLFDQKVLAFVSIAMPSFSICIRVVWAWQGPGVLYQCLGWGSLPHRQQGSLETLNLYRTMLTHNFVTLFSVTVVQLAKKVVSDSPGLVDFAIGLVNSLFNLPNRQVMSFEEFK